MSGSGEGRGWATGPGYSTRTRRTLRPSTVADIEIHRLSKVDQPWVNSVLREHWGSPQVARQGELIEAGQLPGFLARSGATLAGLVTYRVDGDRCEIVTINSMQQRVGIGRTLFEAVRDVAAGHGCICLFAFTTNDNPDAIAFYQRLFVFFSIAVTRAVF